MLKQLNGTDFIRLLTGGIQSLELHRADLNDLNVFPVPDGDTGTNMVMTMRYGFEAIKGKDLALGEAAKAFSSSAVFGARGNSGVILSQFFKGLAAVLAESDIADPALVSRALDSGYRRAYAAVAKPVEGTILTVLRDAANAVITTRPHESVDEIVTIYLTEARASTARTPELLPVLKKAGVVDSGASGIVYFFEGVEKCLRGERIEVATEEITTETLDLSLVDKNTDFSWGYCTEGLLQLKRSPAELDINAFRQGLMRFGNSVVVTLEGDKIKLHVHSMHPGRVLEYCQGAGEFLTLKIENMSLQHLAKGGATAAPKFLYREEPSEAPFGVVAVATTPEMQRLFFEMGADVVIRSDLSPAAHEFTEAFSLVGAKEILVFPNSANSILTSIQASGLYKDARITVLNSRSVGECYACLSTMDFEAEPDEAISAAGDTIAGLYEFAVYHAAKSATFGNKTIGKNEFFALHDKTILHVAGTLEEATVQAVLSTMQREEYALLTIFYGKDMAPQYVDYLKRRITGLGLGLEIATLSTEESPYSLLLTFE